MARPTQSVGKKRPLKRSRIEDEEVQQIEKLIAAGAPASGTNPLALDLGNTSAAARQFDELPMSNATKDGLRAAKYVTLTAIQRAALPHALCGRDVLGAAKTGSGKTLAFIIPVLERLYRSRWTRLDGLGALIITPTRELALQIFEELRKVGKQHEFSAALLVGGKNVKEEKERVSQMNILVCTPGRLLQHMDETPGFDPSQLQVLVLDEADRILDMGFSVTLDAILANLPKQGRQTLLFSATQTKSVKDLSRLSLTNPEYLSVHADAAAPTPVKLQQLYMECEQYQKMDVMWSFIKTHLKSKVLVFMSTCKQVRFIHEAMRKLRPGVPLRCLHGNMKQMKRMAVFYEFCEAKAMVLVATDIAARGLDFPTLDWVLQLDCPEDTAAYIHRVGRTARYLAEGRALMLLTPNEKPGMLAALQEAKIPIQPIKMNPSKTQPVGPALQALLSKNKELKDFAQGALTSYLRSIFLQPRKDIFDVTKLPVTEYAQSIGLMAAPRLRFLKRAGKKLTEVTVGGDVPLALEGPSTYKTPVSNSDQPALATKRSRPTDTDPAPAAKKSKLLQSSTPDSNPAVRQSTASEQADTATRQDLLKETGRTARKGNDSAREEQEHLDDGQMDNSAEDVAGEGRGLLSTAGVNSDGRDDDFLVLKHRNVFDEAAGEELPGEGMEVVDGKKKKKKQKINASRGSGQRMVFDEAGNAVEPLALLAAAELGNREDDITATKDGLHVVRDKAEERFELARQHMRLRDARDKAQQKALRKQTRADKKARRKNAQDDAAVAVLGGGESSEGYSSGGDSEGEEDAPRGRGVRPAAKVTVVLNEAEPEPAHFGMAVKRAAAKIRKEQEEEIDALPLEDKEALALKLLSARRN